MPVDRRLTLDECVRLPRPGMDHPAAITFTPDGSALTYLQSADGSLVRSLWWHDLATGERRVIAGPLPEATTETTLGVEEQLRRERTRTEALGVTEYAWAAEASEPTLVVPIAGRVFAAVGEEARTGVHPLPAVEGASSAIVSPDGRAVAFVRAGDLWVAPIDGGPPLRLTDDAEPGIFNGLAEYIAAEELERFEGLWWSADSSAIAYAHVDERAIPEYVIAHLGADPPAFETHRYPFPGGPNARVSLRIVAATGGPFMPVDLAMVDGDYLARVIRHPLGGWLAAVLLRMQRSLRWLRVHPDGGTEEVWVETAAPWLNLDDHTRVLSDGRVLRSTERTGFRHLELREPDGGLGPTLTAGPWVVTNVVHVDEARGEVLFMATHDGATERHLYAVPLETSEPVEHPARLTSEPGWHEAVVSADGGHWVETWSDIDRAPAVTVRDRGGVPTVVIHEPTATLESARLALPELLELKAADGATTLHAALYRPRDREAGRPPPCVVWVYGGPHSQYVERSWGCTVVGIRQYLADAGAVVLVVDNRGTAYRGIDFEAILDRRLGAVEVADQAAAVRQLVAMGEIDGGRVGIIGGSYGGFMTLMAMGQQPDLFRVGVAISPVADWTGYDTAYCERYLATPATDPEAYADSSALGRAASLEGDLLLIHGTLDENVHLRHSVRLLAAFQAADRDVELVLLPDQRHHVRGQTALTTRDRRTAAHLLAGLGLPVPPDAAVAPKRLAPRRGNQAASIGVEVAQAALTD